MKNRTRKNKNVYKPNFIPRLSPIKEESEVNRQRRQRLSSEEAFKKLLNKWSKIDKENRNRNIKLLNKELAKTKNETMNLLSNNRSKRKRKFTFKGLGKRLGTNI